MHRARLVAVLVVAAGCSSKRPRGDEPSPEVRVAAGSEAGTAHVGPGSGVGSAGAAGSGVGTAGAAGSGGAGNESAVARGSGSAPAPDAGPPIVDAPMRWSDERAALTLAYRRRHSDGNARDLEIAPRVIVLHYTGGSSAKATRSYFDNTRIEASRAGLARAGAVNVSSHFVVDRDGTIYRLQPETRFARHCIGLNHLAIGIENAGDGERWPLTGAQVAANVALVRALAKRFSITHLLGHHEVMAFRAHPYYVEREPAYRNDKPDPGPEFMRRVRAELADLGLADR